MPALEGEGIPCARKNMGSMEAGLKTLMHYIVLGTSRVPSRVQGDRCSPPNPLFTFDGRNRIEPPLGPTRSAPTP